MNVHNSTIYVGDSWTAQDNFDSAMDKDGNTVDFSQVTVDDSKVDTSKAGTYDVTYTYDGVISTAKITVKNKQSADVTVKYLDTDGNEIHASQTIRGNIGEAYNVLTDTYNLVIEGYIYNEVQGSATGTFTDQAQTVTYVYMKNDVTPSPKPDDHSNTPESSTDNGKKSDSTSENKNTLPQAGDNEGVSTLGMISGLFLFLGTIVMNLFKRKRQD